MSGANSTLRVADDGIVQGLDPAPMPFGPATVADILAAAPADRIALIDSTGALTYGELEHAVRAATAALSDLGLEPQDRIAACCQNHSAMIIAFLAAQRLGLVWVGIHRVLADDEKCTQLHDAGVRVLLADPASAAQLSARQEQLPVLRSILTTGPDAALAWPALIASCSGRAAVCPPIDRLAPAALTYTSGTTGLPKAAVHTQHGIMTFINAGLTCGRGGVWEPGLCRSVTIALTILNGMNYGPLIALASGGSFVSMDRIDSQGVAQWIERAAIQVLCCTPPTIYDLLFKDSLQHVRLDSLRYVLAGGAAGAVELRAAFRARIGSELIDEYGMTEAPSGVAGSRCDRLPPDGFIGQPYPHVEIAALDDAAEPLPPGRTGEIGIRAVRSGPWAGVFTGMIGYWRQPDETRATLRNGWLCTGDLGVIDAQGNLALVGRKKELIIRGGANVYPAEIERVLRAQPQIEDAVVLGMPDERLGEIVAAYLKLSAGTPPDLDVIARLAAACSAKLARYKVPARWFVVDEIPRNTMNKPDRKRLRTAPCRELTPQRARSNAS